ncbi:hypothetical protein [Rhizobium leguminosarum]|uniref:hypothetical protein n=1 Tax=Rhizobium leguminosarum TaxID=384 RepID=UPI0021BBE6AE|nr:hypothetical protein [Rhizobium leguminosarum]
MIEPELPGDDFKRLAVGERNVAVGKGLPQCLCHELGIAKIAHDVILPLAANRKISARVC